MDKNISTLLGEIKAATNWSESQLAAELGTSQPTVNRILNGQAECMGSTFLAITSLHKEKCPATSKRRTPKRRATDRTSI